MVFLCLFGSVSSSSDLYQHPNDVCIAGYSDQILRFVAERGNGGQLNHVENIDKAYGLQTSAVSLWQYVFVRCLCRSSFSKF